MSEKPEDVEDRESLASTVTCEFIRRLPRPVVTGPDCAYCPWCGWGHDTITFGRNLCEGCAKAFCYGNPPWDSGEKCPVSWVHFSGRELDLAIANPRLLPPQHVPNEILKQIYMHMDSRQAAPSTSTRH